MIVIRLTIIACNLFLFGYCQNLNFKFENITTKEGLSDNNINAIVQDAQGYIWIGSEEGLTRYDGYSCVVYLHSNDNPYSLSDNEIYALCIDAEGVLWIGTRNGLNKYDALNDHFETFFHDSSKEKSISHNEVFALAKDIAGDLWIGTFGGGLDKMVKTKKGYQFIHHKHDNLDNSSISNDEILSISFDWKGQAWIGTSDGLNLLKRGAEKFIHFYNQKGSKNSISSNYVYRAFTNSDDSTIWICGKGMLDNITLRESASQDVIHVQHYLTSISDVRESDNWDINNIVIDRNGNGWVATQQQGLIKFILQQDKVVSFERFFKSRQIPNSLVNSTVNCLFEDRSGIIWIGTAAGISKYIYAKERFNKGNFLTKLIPADRQYIMNLLSDKQHRFWLTYVSPAFSVINKKNDNSFSVQTILLSTSINDIDQINVLYQSRAGDIYIGTLYEGLFVVPKSLHKLNDKKKWIKINTDKYSTLPSNNIYSITEDSAGLIWIGTYTGLCNYSPSTRQIQSVYASPAGNVISGYIIRTIHVDEKNFAWCGTDDGMYIVKEGIVVKSFKNIQKDTTSISHNGITVFYTDHNRNKWIGTKEGLNLYDSLHNNFQRYTTRNGLSNDAIRSIKEDTRGNLWIGTNHGLIKYDLKENKFYTYGIEDGLNSDQFVTGAVCSDSSGIFYFGTNDGLVSFKPENIIPNNYVPPVVITNIKLFNTSLLSLEDTNLVNTYKRENKLLLRYNQNFFSFEFAALNYINSAANQYAYKLENIDKQWNYVGTQRFAGYTDIPPGNYVFKVKAANNDGVWNNIPATISVIIAPPWWQTWWFYALCAIVVSAIIYLIYRMRLQQILKVYRLRSSIAKDLHDDVGSALSSIAMLSSIAQDGKTTVRLKPEEVFSRISNTSKRMIDLMDDIVWTINPSNDRFGNMLVRMKEYVVEILEARDIAFTFKIAEEVDEVKIPMEIRKDYFLIFKEAVNNLAKYSECSNTTIMIQHTNHTLITTIADDGKGFDQNIIHSGNGLKNMQDRANSLKGKLHIHTKCGGGTRVTLMVPVP